MNEEASDTKHPFSTQCSCDFAAFGYNPQQVCSEVSLVLFSRAHSQEGVFRTVAFLLQYGNAANASGLLYKTVDKITEKSVKCFGPSKRP